jgi:hypothetical protein
LGVNVNAVIFAKFLEKIKKVCAFVHNFEGWTEAESINTICFIRAVRKNDGIHLIFDNFKYFFEKTIRGKL